MLDAINWNAIEDDKDKELWDRSMANFWIDTKIALSNDIKTWATLSPREKEMTKKVLGGLTMLDTLQSFDGVPSLIPDARTDHEKAVLTQFTMMESIHAKSYSSIFSTLCSSEEIADIFKWIRENLYLQAKANMIQEHYQADCPLMRKVASVALESFLFYSGFYTPMYWLTKAKLTNTGDIIKLIVRDESLHGYYIGYKFQLAYKELSGYDRLKIYSKIIRLFEDLYDNEMGFIQEVYGGTGLEQDVIRYVNYNYNRAFQNLGFDAKFHGEDIAVNPAILAALDINENHDFFSGSGSNYEVAKVEETLDEDWNFG